MTDQRFTLLPGERLDSLNDRGLAVIQPEKGYRFSMDAVLLSHFARLRKNERAADLGTGCGVIPLLLVSREPTLSIDAVELDEAAADRAERSVRGNALEGSIRVVQGDLRHLPEALPRAAFSLVICNPPYGSSSPTGPERVLPTAGESCSFEDAVSAARALLRFSGRFACCWPAAKLQEAMTVLSRHRFSVKRLRPVSSKPGKSPYLCLIEATLGGRLGMVFEPPLLVMDEEGQYTEEIRQIYGTNQ